MIDLTPRRLIKSLKWRLAKIFPDQEYEGNNFECPLCMSQLAFFLPIPAHYLGRWYDNQYLHPIFQLETMNFANYLCPVCSATDRDRLYAIYFRRYLGTIDQPIDLLDIAPSKQLRTLISSFSKVTYRSADLSNELADDIVDIRNMSIYRNESFDFFVCSHVLEHVDDDRAACRELFRILKTRGKGIAMVPIDLSLEANYENPRAVTENDRWRHFCQGDHIRLYSKTGFIKLFEDAGFYMEQFGVHYFGEEAFAKAGIHPRSVLYIANKN